ncbi:MAG: 3-deoxy-manno-octulosonate cytidylyltransferase [Theionarchaea archaeon]|nr:3-deoxy-manno-octulosonate cytidylyltransferase [Theionarchaea archaeon]
MVKVLGVIPARYGSTRLEGKVVADIGGKPMIQHVWERSMAAKLVDDVIVAVDDPRTQAASEAFGARVVMTSPSHTCGTERVEEAARRSDADIVVNIQGDEPFIWPGTIDEAIQPLIEDKGTPMSTVMRRIVLEEELQDPSVVKVVTDANGFALYFSRSLIPYPRKYDDFQAYEHLGIYAFRKDFLTEFVNMEPTVLERTEVLEQLRALENGFRIKCVLTSYEGETLSVDTAEDLARANEVYARMLKDEGR